MISSDYPRFFKVLADARRVDATQYEWLNVEASILDSWCYYDTVAVYMDEDVKLEQRSRELTELTFAGLAKIMRREGRMQLVKSKADLLCWYH